MYKQIQKLDDIDSLQGIVDIVESSGSFEVSETTFDFDLCGLQVETLDAIRTFLDTACTAATWEGWGKEGLGGVGEVEKWGNRRMGPVYVGGMFLKRVSLLEVIIDF